MQIQPNLCSFDIPHAIGPSTSSFHPELNNITPLIYGSQIFGYPQKGRPYQRHMIGSSEIKRCTIKRRLSNLCLSKHQIFNTSISASSYFSLDLEKADERYLLCGGTNGEMTIFDLQPVGSNPKTIFQPVAHVKKSSNHKSSNQSMISSCQWYPCDTGLFSTATIDGYLKLWNSNTMKCVDTYKFDKELNQHHWSCLHPSLIAVAMGKSNIHIVDVRTGSKTQQLHGHKKNVTCVQWSTRDSNILCSTGLDGNLIFWDVRSGKYFLTLLKPSRHVKAATEAILNGLKWAKDGLSVLTASGNGLITKWDAVRLKEQKWNCMKDGKFTHLIVPRKLYLFEIADLGTDSLIFLPAEDDIEVMSLETGQVVRILRGHYNPVNSCVYKCTTQELFSTGSDRNLLAWNPKTDEMSAVKENEIVKPVIDLTNDHWSDDD